MKKNVKLDENYYLITQVINDKKVVEIQKSVNHIIVIDVSGSMSYELPEIRKNLKNKISSLVKENDTLTLIWFSGHDQAGILKEEVHVDSLEQLNKLNEAIDRFLKPIGFTAFAKPLELVNVVINRISAHNSDSVFSLCFMSDGGNNDCSWGDVTKAMNKISPKLSASLVVEYGFYADSQRLTEMSAALGGEKINCEGFEEYDVVISNTLKKPLSGGKKVSIEISDKYLHDFAFSVTDGSILVYNINDNKILVGADVKEVHFFSPKAVGDNNFTFIEPLYAATYILADKLQFDLAEKVIATLGDNYHYKMLSGAYGKQKLNTFKTAIKDCVIDVNKRFPNGRGLIEKIDDNAYCLMNLINDLGNIEGCLFYPNHSDFKYNRIGRKRTAVGSTLTDTDKQRLAEAKNVDEASAILKELEEKKVDIKFVSSNPDRGYVLTDLVWNESRANLSVRIKIEGYAILPKNKGGIDELVTYKYRTYTLIKDGIVNVEKLPVTYSHELNDLLSSNGVKFNDVEATINSSRLLIIDLSSLPIINRGMVKSISAKELATAEFELVKLQAENKVYKHYREILYPKTSKSFVEIFGQEFADWLKGIGITDYNGFAPKVTEEESTDFYMSVNLDVKIKGMSSLPKVEDIVKKIAENKALKPNESLIANAIKNYNSQVNSEIFKSATEEMQKEMLKTYLTGKTKQLNIDKKLVAQKIAEIKFSLILSRGWFKEFKSLDENQLSLKIGDYDLDFTFDLNEKEVKI